ncbi:hypothetical protein [Bradyrhizobium sp. RT10b]|uniref:hypothetical protein n=1 Tax=Bradyrhizobium sp. RT10b TaxID=3156331 RepID=UPI00339B3AFF
MPRPTDWALAHTCTYGTEAHLSEDMQAELRRRGLICFKPFWRRWRDKWKDRWWFYRHQMREGFFLSILFTIF